MKIRHKLISLVGLMFSGALILLISLVIYTKNFRQSVDSFNQAEELVAIAGKIVWLDEVLTQSTRNYIFTKDKKWKSRYDTYGEKLDSVIKRAKVLADSKYEKRVFSLQDEANLNLVKIELQAHFLVEKGDIEKAKIVFNSSEYTKWKKKYEQIINEYQEYRTVKFEEIKQLNLKKLNELLSFAFFSLGVGCIIVFFSYFIISNSFVKSLSKLDIAAKGIAEGDLDQRTYIMTNDEFQDLGKSFNTMAQRLKEVSVEMDKANKAKDNFLANMSHEIRTPLNGVIGVVQLIQSTRLSEEQKELVGILESSSKDLYGVVNDVLDYSKIVEGKIKIEKIKFSLEELINDCVDLAQPQAKIKGLKVSKKLGCKGHYLGDPTKIKQILNNLISNAIKFTEKGSVDIAVSENELSTNYNLIFSISDTGIGISPSEIGKIFLAFEQADISTTRKYGGTGLGLSISSSLAKIMDGEIICESKLGQGTKVCYLANLDKA